MSRNRLKFLTTTACNKRVPEPRIALVIFKFFFLICDYRDVCLRMVQGLDMPYGVFHFRKQIMA